MVLTTASVFPASVGHQFMPWPSRRSVVHSTRGIVACSQPLAARCGLEILHKGGNAADAAVAVAAAINMTEPCQTGIGGDMFCLFFDAKTKKVSALNGSGRAGGKCTLETMRRSLGLGEGADEEGKIPMSSVHAVTVPGAAAGWVDTVERFGSGKLSLEEILEPAIKMGEEGFPVHEQTATIWAQGEESLRNASPNFREMLKADPSAPDGARAPKAGEIIKLPNLARTFRALAAEGKKGFYTGRVAEEIIKVTSSLGGHLTLEDLEHHLTTGSESVEPISLKFTGQGAGKAENAGVEVWEHPPNGQGIVALMALGILQQLELSGQIPTWTEKDHNTAPYLHAIIEALRIAFSDANWWVADPNVSNVPTSGLLSPEYLAERSKLFSPTKASPELIPHGSPALRSSDTVYFAVSDSEGNAISFINSNYGGFGTGIIPAGCGFTLQNRGANFSLDPNHPNVLAPRKRPYHTIIPGLVTNIDDGSLHSVFGVMGGFMQPQGHVQTLLGQIVGGLNPQQALDAPRICIGAGMPENGKVYDMRVYVEEGMPEETVEGLRKLGHEVTVVEATPGEKWQSRSLFGRGQIIRWTVDSVEKDRGVWSAGSDMRGDGGAFPV
ncbi:putative gamma-glutamyltranspeptidase precursor [Triangularia verruculosa]|uniref:Gamma-glutamyltranspeptidase n=1 Tax=Triangularia verruculosa TaxID=2587418 RepID=A0AAN6XPU9_9PEZI|nr:putative gamma-glutamyltranspeptidase precursor [Triangularia verruculosa]